MKKSIQEGAIKKILIGHIIGIPFGIIAAILFGLYTTKTRDPILLINPNKSTLIKQSDVQEHKLKIYDSQGVQITEDLNILTFYFFNNGDESIKRDNILKPLTVQFSEPIKIIELNKLKVSRDLCQIKMSIVDSIKNIIGIEFKILEKDDGFTGQVMYAGNPHVKIVLDGTIEGFVNIKESKRDNPIPLYSAIIACALLFLLILLLVAIYISYNKSAYKRKFGRSFFQQLNTKYQIVIFNEEYPIERSSQSFTYGKVFLTSCIIAFFSITFGLLIGNMIKKSKNEYTIESTIPKLILP